MNGEWCNVCEPIAKVVCRDARGHAVYVHACVVDCDEYAQLRGCDMLRQRV